MWYVIVYVIKKQMKDICQQKGKGRGGWGEAARRDNLPNTYLKNIAQA